MRNFNSTEEYQAFVINILDSYKCRSRCDALKCLRVYDDSGNVQAFLWPITYDVQQIIPQCTKMIGDWRAQNPSISRSSFQITQEKTEKWMREQLILRSDRILFLILSLQGTWVGHIGLSDFCFEKKAANLDLVLRGVKGVLPGLMSFCIQALFYWGKNELALKSIELCTFEENGRALRLYERCGFQVIGKKAIQKSQNENGFAWIPAEDKGQAEKYEIMMKRNLLP